MANLHSNFHQYNEKIRVPEGRKKVLRTSRIALQNRIIRYFKDKPNVPTPRFFIQGSYKMKTMILAEDGTYDVDLGVYFLAHPGVEAATLQRWVRDAVEGHTQGGCEHREKCVRVIYNGDYNVDLPVYIKLATDRHPKLATKLGGYQPSDPKQLCDWFKEKQDKNGQMLRLVRYAKSWANRRPWKMPSGVALSVWVATHYVADQRDDVAFVRTLWAIQNHYRYRELSCINPAEPKDDLVGKLSSDQKTKFKVALAEIVSDGSIAIQNSMDEDSALRLWRKHLK